MNEQSELNFTAHTRAAQIEEAFQAFHLDNPEVWRLFEKYAFQMIATGRAHYSAATIFELIRWHTDLQTKDADCKLNNNFRAYYARMFHRRHPEHDGFFRNREQTSKEQPARHPDRQYFEGAPEK